MFKRSFILVGFLILLASCQKDDSDKSNPCKNRGALKKPTPVSLDFPAHFGFLVAPEIPVDNPLTEEGIALGKKLFFEKKLSKDNSISCGSCHDPRNSFNDKDKQFSAGVGGALGKRNAMPLYNLAWGSVTSKKFNWHGSVESLEKQAFDPVRIDFEMNESWIDVMGKLQSDNSYPPMFEAAFGTDFIDSNLVVKALAQFERTLISGNSSFDKYVLEEVAGIDIPGENHVSAQVLRGFELFLAEEKGDCAHCHGSEFNPLWTDNLMRNNGLDEDPDSGFASVTKNPMDLGKFKTPSIRNLLFTAPYMHDGRFNTIREVVDFYIDDLKTNSPNIDAVIVKRRSLSNSEREDLVAFLESLTDSSFVNNPDFQP